jgi:hypothetical protein
MYCGSPLLLQVLHHAMHFVVGDEGAVHADRHAGARGEIEHVALPEQRFRAHLVEDRARVDAARDLEAHARRNVGLDQPGDHVDARPLGGEDQVHAGGTRLLRDARDQFFDLLAGDHHHVGQLVDHDHDHRHRRERLGVFRRQRERIGSFSPLACASAIFWL